MRSAGVPVESIIEYVRLYQAGDTTLQARRDLLKDVHTSLLKQRQQMDAAIDRLSFKIRRYDAALKTGVLSWEEDDGQ